MPVVTLEMSFGVLLQERLACERTLDNVISNKGL
jgi:hypothetical protein